MSSHLCFTSSKSPTQMLNLKYIQLVNNGYKNDLHLKEEKNKVKHL